MTAKKKIAVRELLEWAYADELVHAARREGMPMELALKFSTRMAAMNATAMAVADEVSLKIDFEAPHDAYVVHGHVLKLGTATIEVPIDPSTSGRHSSPYLANAVAGERVAEFASVIVDLGQLVAEHAMRREQPEFFLDPITRMKPGGIVYHPRSKKPWYCVVTPTGDTFWQVARAHALYAAWADALRRLKAALPVLDRFAVTAELPHPAPWRRSP